MRMSYKIRNFKNRIAGFIKEYETKQEGIVDVDLDLKSKDFVDFKNKYIFLLCFNFIFCGFLERDYNSDNQIQISTLMYESFYCHIDIRLICFDEGECRYYTEMPFSQLKDVRDKYNSFWQCTEEQKVIKYETPKVLKCLFELALLYCLRKRNIFFILEI
jgi:hypothetical protein